VRKTRINARTNAVETRDKRSPFPETVRAAIRIRGYSQATEQAYLDRTKHFILFHKTRPSVDMADTRVAAYLSYLAVDPDVPAST
jgi:hypothetical protein